MDRSVVVGVNVFIGGFGSIGAVESFKAPALKQKKQTNTTAVGDRSVSYGALESLDAEYTFKALPESIFTEMQKLDVAEIISKTAKKQGSETISMEWVCTGTIDLEYGEFKNGEYLDVKITQTGCKKYAHEVGGKVKANIDHDNIICEIDGVDILADVRNAILS